MPDALVELREAWGALTLARSRGEQSEAAESIADLEAAYHPARARIGRSLSAPEARYSDEFRAYACSSVGWMDEWEPPPAEAVRDPCRSNLARGEDAAIGALRRSTLDAHGQAASAIVLPDGSVADRLSVLERLARTDGEADRRSLFRALEPVWHGVDGDGDGALLRFGGERRAGPLLLDFLGGPLTADPLLEDIGRL